MSAIVRREGKSCGVIGSKEPSFKLGSDRFDDWGKRTPGRAEGLDGLRIHFLFEFACVQVAKAHIKSSFFVISKTSVKESLLYLTELSKFGSEQFDG